MICNCCKVDKPESDFYIRRDRNRPVYSCKPCMSAKAKKVYEDRKEHIAARNEAYRKANTDKINIRRRRNYAAEPEKFQKDTRKWRDNHPEKLRESGRRSKLRRRGCVYRENTERRKLREQATPKWLTEEQLKQIEDIYATCPPGFHVDHIHPLKGENVCGLHVPWNLQHLTKEENLRKGNKLVA